MLHHVHTLLLQWGRTTDTMRDGVKREEAVKPYEQQRRKSTWWRCKKSWKRSQTMARPKWNRRSTQNKEVRKRRPGWSVSNGNKQRWRRGGERVGGTEGKWGLQTGRFGGVRWEDKSWPEERQPAEDEWWCEAGQLSRDLPCSLS